MTETGNGPAAKETFKPPWMAFATYWNFIDELASHPLPPVIDRSLMSSKSGSDQAALLSALRSFDQITATNEVTPALTAITVSDLDDRKRALASLVEHYYAAPLQVSRNNGTQAQLYDCFRDQFGITGGDTLRKAATFFLHAARHAGLTLSPHFPQIRAGQGAPGTRKTRKRVAKKTAVSDGGGQGEQATPPPKSEYELTVQLATGGSMTLTVSVNPLNLRGAERAFFYDIVDKLTEYQEAHPDDGAAADQAGAT